MTKEISLFNNLIKSNYIDRVIDNSNKRVGRQRARVYFKNGHSLSIVRDAFDEGVDNFEIMPSDEAFLDEKDEGDVCGDLSIERVNYYINKIGGLRSKRK